MSEELVFPHVEDEIIENFLRRYGEYLVPARNVNIRRKGDVILVNDEVYFKGGKFFFEGVVFGEEYKRVIEEDELEYFVGDYGGNEEIVKFLLLEGGDVMHVGRNNIMARFDRIIVEFIVVDGIPHVYMDKKIIEVKGRDDLNDFLEWARGMYSTAFDYFIVYSNGWYAYLRRVPRGVIILEEKMNMEVGRIIFARDFDFSRRKGVRVLFNITFPGNNFSIAFMIVTKVDNLYDLTQKIIAVKM